MLVHPDAIYVKFEGKVIRQIQEKNVFFFGCGCTLGGEVCILIRLRAAPNVGARPSTEKNDYFSHEMAYSDEF